MGKARVTKPGMKKRKMMDFRVVGYGCGCKGCDFFPL